MANRSAIIAELKRRQELEAQKAATPVFQFENVFLFERIKRLFDQELL